MSQGDLSLDSFRRILELHPQLEHIELQGEGEPLLNKNFVQMLELARERNIRVSLITNGSLLTTEMIDAILRLEVMSIHCSMESAEPRMFREIRGGKLEKVRKGLMLLVKERNKRGLKFPTIGLAVTVLRKTVDAMPGMIELYGEMGLDAGIFVQPLQKMAVYTRAYDEDMKRQLLSHEDLHAYNNTLRGMDGLQSILRNKKNISSFYRALGKSIQPGESGCPWLLHGTYINYAGDVMPCCTIKDTTLSGLGHIRNTPLSKLDEGRRKMNQQIVEGAIPMACEGCGIANKFQRKKT